MPDDDSSPRRPLTSPMTDTPSTVRRRDRSKEDAWVKAALAAAPYGFLATVADGQPFINSNLYAYDEGEHCIYIHTARLGRTRSNLEGSEPVCFSIASMGRLLPAPEALEFSVEYSGVTVFGRGRVLADESEKEHGLQLILDRYAPHLKPGTDYRPITKAELKRTAVFRIDIDEWSGKQKQVEPDFPGAFELPGTAGFPLAEDPADGSDGAG